MAFELHLERLPRTVALTRGGAASHGFAAADEAVRAYVQANHVPDGFPVFVMLDQRRLPEEEAYLCTADWRCVVDAVRTLAVRGAPAIGIAGAAALALRAAEFCVAKADDHREDAADFDRVFVLDDASFDPDIYLVGMGYAAKMIAHARPTAVNLSWAVERAMDVVRAHIAEGAGARETEAALYGFVQQMIADDEAANRAIGKAGAALLPPGARVLTHCNAGSLATSFYGTALGIVYAAAEEGGIERVYADETRPVCQGSRLTAWELARAGVPVTLICDDMAPSALSRGMVDAVVVGADRIAANGDVANKIGTLGVAVCAHAFGVPFYVAAPTSTIDRTLASGADIPIEERDASEVACAPAGGVDVWNPAFDVTPASYVTAIVTERGVVKPDEISRL